MISGRCRHVEVDRIGPTVRPNRRAVMHQHWQDVTFLHWAIPPERLRPRLPAGLELDVHEGMAYLGLTLLTVSSARPAWLPPVPILSSFHEINLQTYVHSGGRDPGIWLFSRDASSALAVALARAFYGLPYYWARIAVDVIPGASDGPAVIEYSLEPTQLGQALAACKARCAPRAEPEQPDLGSREFFLSERYVSYNTFQGDLYRSRLYHEPWPLQDAELLELDETVVAAAGIDRPDEARLVYYARGARVEIFPAEPVH